MVPHSNKIQYGWSSIKYQAKCRWFFLLSHKSAVLKATRMAGVGVSNPDAHWSSIANYVCCGSMIFCRRSGSADPCLLLVDPDPDPAFFVIYPQDAHKKPFLIFFCFFTFWRYIYNIFQRLKVKKKSKSIRNQGFSYYCLMTGGSGAGLSWNWPYQDDNTTSSSCLNIKS